MPESPGRTAKNQQFSFCNRTGSHAPAWEHGQTLQRPPGAGGDGPRERSDGIPTLERGNENPRNRVLTEHESKKWAGLGWVWGNLLISPSQNENCWRKYHPFILSAPSGGPVGLTACFEPVTATLSQSLVDSSNDGGSNDGATPVRNQPGKTPTAPFHLGPTNW